MIISERTLKDVYYDTMNFCFEEPVLSEAVRYGLRNTEIYKENDYPVLPVLEVEKAGVVSVTKERTFESAMRIHKEAPEKKIAVLNFASASKPGGGVKNGRTAQEESLCRCSTLMPVLEQRKTMDEFYIPNKKADNPLYNDTCIYSPGVIICKSDADVPERLKPEDFVTVDVISCAAPNLNNPRVRRPSDENLIRLNLNRAKHILHVAALHEVDVLVTGAFGCGVFGNSPLLVANAWKKAIKEYRTRFDEIVFAIYSKEEHNKNYLIFKTSWMKRPID